VLASAVYLKAAWMHPFPAGATQDAPFYPDPGPSGPGHPDPGLSGPGHPDPGRQVAVPTMRVRAWLRYLRGGGYQAVELPYTGGRLGMVIVLPDPASGPDAGGPDSAGPDSAGPDHGAPGRLLAAGAAPGAGLQGLLAGLAPRQVSLALPRFQITSGFALRPVLAALGMPLAFTAAADFSGITTAQRLSIDEVVHQAYISVNEQGTEAAAATAVIATAAARRMGGDPPVEMVVDRPFLFGLTDLRSGLLLFLGRVTDPTAG
jgi:Serpin (serine protease inhibitor)